MPFQHPNVSVLRVATPLDTVDSTVKRMRLFILLAADWAGSRSLRAFSHHTYCHDGCAVYSAEHTEWPTDTGNCPRDNRRRRDHSTSSLSDRLGEALEDIVAALAHERDRFAAVLDGMKEAVIAVDGERRITLVNPAALEFLEVPAVELGTPLESVITSLRFWRPLKPPLVERAQNWISSPGMTLDMCSAEPLQAARLPAVSWCFTT